MTNAMFVKVNGTWHWEGFLPSDGSFDPSALGGAKEYRIIALPDGLPEEVDGDEPTCFRLSLSLERMNGMPPVAGTIEFGGSQPYPEDVIASFSDWTKTIGM